MTTISITLENPSLVTTLKNLIANLNGIVSFNVSEIDSFIPNRTTEKAIQEATDYTKLKGYTSAKDLLADCLN